MPFYYFPNITRVSNIEVYTLGNNSMSLTSKRNRVRRAAHDDNAINHQVANEPVIGKEAIKKMFEQEFSLAKMICIVENIFEDGQWAILEWRDPLGLRGCGFFQIVNDKIIFQRGYWDKLFF